MVRKYLLLPIQSILAIIVVLFNFQNAKGQSNITFDLKKPKAYQDRKLPSELTREGKINPIKRVKENIVSHYNFYFNANLKIRDVIKSAKASHKDTFNQLLSFYDFSLDQTLARQQDLDSVIIKSNNGILLHDLRNDWIDDLYLLMGQSYFYQKKFDSAYDVFQYINYNFQPREKSEKNFEKTIGSNRNAKGNVYIISSPESKGITAAVKHRPIRNEALLWIARTLIEQNNDDDARGMIETLSRDISFPKRLNDQLSEIKAYWFYRRNEYDSAAYYLEKSLTTCENNQERARRCYLIAQLHALDEKWDWADKFFEKTVSITTDPIMEAYARINQISLAREEADKEKKVDQNIKALTQMADREKYIAYRPIIYNAAAEMEKARKNLKGAIGFYVKSNKENSGDLFLRNKNHLAIAEMAFELKDFNLAKSHFDSIDANGLADPEKFLQKKAIVTQLAQHLETIRREDSLQKIAAMPEKERMLFLNEMIKKNSKASGKSESAANMKGIGGNNGLLLPEQQTGNLFPTGQKKGEWYFNNASLIAQGKTTFRNKWGERPNVDNWRRSVTINAMLKSNVQKSQTEIVSETKQISLDNLTIEELSDNLPLGPEKIKQSNEKKYDAYRKLAVLYKEKLADCKESIDWNEKLISEQKDHSELDKILFDLALCYKEINNESKSSFYKGQLLNLFPQGQLATIIKDPMSFAKADKEEKERSTSYYQKVYDLFISGDFDRALAEKKKADSIFGQNKWSPQLLYIESVYYIKTNQDSLAIATLNKIPAMYSGTGMAVKAGQLADVVTRRKEIELELSSMNVVRVEEEKIEIEEIEQIKKRLTIGIDTKKDSLPKTEIKTITSISQNKIEKDIKVKPTAENKSGYEINPSEPYAFIIQLEQVDVVYVTETKLSFRRFNGGSYITNNLNVNDYRMGATSLLVISQFEDLKAASEYIGNTLPAISKQIIPWLSPNKYKCFIISLSNLEKVKAENTTLNYIELIKGKLPGKYE